MRRYPSGLLPIRAASLLLLALALGMISGTRDSLSDDARPEEGHLAPDFALNRLDGKKVRLSDLRGKKVVLINFWATWCPPCRLEMPTMQQIYSEYKAKGFEILAVNIEPDAQQEIRDFIKELRLTFPVALDPDMKVSRKYRLVGLPVS